MEFPISSFIEGINWPALPAVAGASRLSTLFQIEQYQWWPYEKIHQQQFKQLDALLRHSVKHVPYYSDVLSNIVVAASIDAEQWKKIPLLTRDKLQQTGERLRSAQVPPDHGKLHVQRTSGSTGKPVEVIGTGVTNFFWDVFTLRDTLWHHSDMSLKLAVIRHLNDEKARPPHGIRAPNWGRATEGLSKTGECVMVDVHTPIADQVEWLLKEKPAYIQTNPSVLQAVAFHCQRGGVEFPFLREVYTISEALPDGLRELCRDVWGVELIDIYSTIELGYLALQCPEHEHYHVQSEGVLLEVLDDDGEPCAPGEVGRVVVTNLHNFATPLIRYELGDYAEVGAPCPCGRGLPVINRILGRYRNLVVLPDGERVWPQFGIAKILKIAPVKQYQGIQHTLHEVEFLLVMESPLNDEMKQQLGHLFISNLHPEMKVTIREVTEIPRSASGKYEEFVSKL